MSTVWGDITVSFQLAFGHKAFDAAPVWEDVSEYVEAHRIDRGRNSLLGRFEAGTATWQIDNSDGRFDPNNTGSPYSPNVKIGVPGRLVVTHNLVDYEIFRGLVGKYPLDYSPDSEYAGINLPLTDYTRLLALDRRITNSYPRQSSDDRINAILDDIGWPAALRDVDAGVADVAAATIAGDEILTHLEEVAFAEVGHFFIARDGKATFRSRVATAGGVASLATFGADPGIEFDEIKVPHDTDDVYNAARITRTGVGVEQEITDTAAIADLGYEITYTRLSDLLVSDSHARNVAEWVVGRGKEVKTRIRGLSYWPVPQGAVAWPAALGIDLRDPITVQWQPPGGGTALDQLSVVESITHTASGAGKWLTKYTCHPLSALETEDFWVLGTSQLGIDTVLA